MQTFWVLIPASASARVLKTVVPNTVNSVVVVGRLFTIVHFLVYVLNNIEFGGKAPKVRTARAAVDAIRMSSPP